MSRYTTVIHMLYLKSKVPGYKEPACI